MASTVLTEHESACRASHEQVQLLQHLYGRLAEDGSEQPAGVDAAGRVEELRHDRQLLVAKLKALGLLRTEPDPEREGLLELATGIRRALGGGDDHAVIERLLTEEREYLRLCEQLAAHDEDPRMVESMDRTQAAIDRLAGE